MATTPPLDPAAVPEGAAGIIGAVSGTVYIVHTDGSRTRAEPGAALKSGDQLQTGTDAKVSTTFGDGSVVVLNAKGSLTVEAYAYNPGTGGGTLILSSESGTIGFSAGKIADASGAMSIITPTSTSVINGAGTTGIAVAAHAAGGTVTLLNGPSGLPGDITVTTKGGTKALTQPETSTKIVDHQPPEDPEPATADQLAASYQSLEFGGLPSFAVPGFVDELANMTTAAGPGEGQGEGGSGTPGPGVPGTGTGTGQGYSPQGLGFSGPPEFSGLSGPPSFKPSIVPPKPISTPPQQPQQPAQQQAPDSPPPPPPNAINLADGQQQPGIAVDTVTGDARFTGNVFLTPLNDVITATGGDDAVSLVGIAQNGDRFDGAAGTDTLNLGNNGNTIAVGNTETIQGGTGNDAVTLTGTLSAGNTVDLGGGTDTLILAAGSNTATIRNVETISGTAGSETLTLENALDTGVTVNLGGGSDTLNLIAGANAGRILNVEFVNGTAGADTL
ncbi:MAG: hypothetical protein RIB59_09610, partial [Rhodospirillales bacterium]